MDEGATFGGQGDYMELGQLQERLDAELVAYRDAGCQLAKNEAKYRMALAMAILKERERGTPVTVISDICRGDPAIANLKLRRDTAEQLRDSSREAINAIKLRIRIVNDQINREWSATPITG